MGGTLLGRNGGVPGGGFYSDIHDSSISASAGVVFSAYINLDEGGSTNDEFGIFFFDGTSVRSIARTGDTLAGFGTLTEVGLNFNFTPTEGAEGNGLGDNGQVAFRFTSEGEYKIAVWAGITPFADGFESGDTSAWSSESP